MSSETTSNKKVIHVDMDAFYASIEQLDFPMLKGKPVAVGGNRTRGVVAAASYEARKYGIHSAMPSARAAKLCPDLIFQPPRFDRYKEISTVIQSIFLEYTDLVEPLSLDEAYLDVTHPKKGLPSATLIAREIKEQISLRTGLTASAGISYCKFLAKTASDMDKPDGLYVILPSEAIDFIHHLPVKKFHGIGKSTAEKMQNMGIFTGKDLSKQSLTYLKSRFGKSGQYYFDISRGIDKREVKPDRERKSISAERTFDKELMNMSEVQPRIETIAQEVYNRYQRHGVHGKTITLKIKYGDFNQITRSKTTEEKISSYKILLAHALSLFDNTLLNENGIRLIGVGISNLKVEKPNPQLNIAY